LRQHSSGLQPTAIVLDSDEEDNPGLKSSLSTTVPKNLKRKLDFTNARAENEPPKKKVFWKNSISSDSVSENDEKRNNVTNIEDDSSSDDQDSSGIDDSDHAKEDEPSSNSESSDYESKSKSTKRKPAPTKSKSTVKKNSNRSNTSGFKSKTNELPAKQKINFQQRTDKSRLTHTAIITHTRLFPGDAQIKDIQGVSVWENQMIYFILM